MFQIHGPKIQQISLFPSVFSCRLHSLEFPFPRSLPERSSSCFSVWRVSRLAQEMWNQPLSKAYFSGSRERDFYIASHSPQPHWSFYRTQIKWGFHGPCTKAHRVYLAWADDMNKINIKCHFPFSHALSDIQRYSTCPWQKYLSGRQEDGDFHLQSASPVPQTLHGGDASCFC